MTKPAFLAAVAAVAFGCLFTVARGRADNPNNAGTSNMPFQGQIAIVYAKKDRSTGAELRDPSTQHIGQTAFVVGTGVDVVGSHWSAGKRLWIPVDEVWSIVE